MTDDLTRTTKRPESKKYLAWANTDPPLANGSLSETEIIRQKTRSDRAKEIEPTARKQLRVAFPVTQSGSGTPFSKRREVNQILDLDG